MYDCITEKFSTLSSAVPGSQKKESTEQNDIKLKILSVEKSMEQIVDMLLDEDVNRNMKDLLNQRVTRLKKELQVLQNRLEKIRIRENETVSVVDLAQSWKTADYECKKNVAMLMIHQILINETGDVNIVWNL